MNTLEQYITENDTHNNNQYNNTILNIKHVKHSKQYPYDESFYTPYTFYIPNNLDLEQQLKVSGQEYWIKHIWKLFYILTIVYRGRWNKSNDEKYYNYTIINIKQLRIVVGDKFATKAMRLLIRLGIIESDRHYICGHKSMGYRFTREFDTSFKPVEAEGAPPIPLAALSRIPKINLKTPEHRFLYDNLTQISLHESVTEFFTQFQPESHRQNDYYHRSVEFINAKDWSFFYDNVTGRVFNNVTSLPKLLRPYLLLDGQPIVEIDVANCQPLFLLSLYGESDYEERQKFKNVVLEGEFYEFLNELINNYYLERDAIKKAVYTRILFGSLKQKRYNLYRAFAAQFPILDKKIDSIKTPRYEELARILQTLEADIVINGVIKRIASTSRIPVLTVHDSIITLPEYEDEVNQLLKEEFQLKLGVVAILKKKEHKLKMNEDLLMAA